MNILYLTTHLNIGGISSYVFTLAKGLKNKGHHIFVASSGGELLPKFTREGICHIQIPIKTKSEANFIKMLRSYIQLKNYIKEKNINVIHANTRITQVLAQILSGRLHKSYISTCHGFFKKRLSRIILPCWGDKVIAISEAVKEHLLNDFKVSDEKIRIIHNGIDIEKFKIQDSKSKIEAKKNLGLEESPVIGIIARLSEVKGHAYLIEAMPSVLEKFPDVKLLIAGEGRIKEGLVSLTKRLKIEKNVFFFPNAYDTRQILSAMDLFVLPSLKEGLGLSLMEAQAAGLAVIGSDVGGIKSLIRHGSTGLLVKPADAKGLAEAITQLLGDAQKRESLGENGRIFIGHNFSDEKMVLETEKLYSECLNAKD